jgi:hypothetical protein
MTPHHPAQASEKQQRERVDRDAAEARLLRVQAFARRRKED